MGSSLVSPFFIFDRLGGLSSYSSVEQVEVDLEAIDVRDGEYIGFDRDGRVLDLIVVPKRLRGVWIEFVGVREGLSVDQSGLRRRLVKSLRSDGVASEGMDWEDMVAAAHERFLSDVKIK